MQKRHGMAREHHGNDPAPETQTCWSLWWGGREFNSRVSHYRILLLFRFEVRNVMSLVLVFTRYPAWQAWQVSVSSLITVVKQGCYSYFALCIARLKTRFYSLAFLDHSFFNLLSSAAISLRLQGKLSFPYNCQKMNGQIYVLLC